MKLNIRKLFVCALFFWIFFFFGLTVYSQRQTRHPMVNFGMWNFGDTIGIDETEILIEEYLEFIYYNNLQDFPNFIRMNRLTEQEKDKLRTMSIETSLLPILEGAKENILSIISCQTKYREVKLFSFIEGKFYVPMHSDSANNKNSIERITEKLKTPVTGISYEQAIAYCKWRTTLDSIRSSGSNSVHERYIYSLLTPEEMDIFNPTYDSLTIDKNWSTFNYSSALPPKKDLFKIIKKNFGAALLRSGAYYYHSRKFSKLIDIKGNAAEMTTIKGIAKGGSYYHFAKDSEKGMINTYYKPEMWLGFRCCAKR